MTAKTANAASISRLLATKGVKRYVRTPARTDFLGRTLQTVGGTGFQAVKRGDGVEIRLHGASLNSITSGKIEGILRDAGYSVERTNLFELLATV